jgi:hypothetical protein
MILNLVEQLQHRAIRHPLVSMASFGSIQLYENKSTIKYPYVNFDVIDANVDNNIQTYNIRMYVCDRNKTPYIAYNKAETIANDILQQLEITEYNLKYFTLNFKDVVDGVFVDFEIETTIPSTCVYESLFNHILLEEGGFVLQENGDLTILN